MYSSSILPYCSGDENSAFVGLMLPSNRPFGARNPVRNHVNEWPSVLAREGGREGRREGGREGGKEGGREGGREGRREGRREGGKRKGEKEGG